MYEPQSILALEQTSTWIKITQIQVNSSKFTLSVCERERELLSVEEEDDEAQGSNSLVEQASHGDEGEGAVEEEPSRMETPPARRPEIGRLERIASAAYPAEESDRDDRGDHAYERGEQYLPL